MGLKRLGLLTPFFYPKHKNSKAILKKNCLNFGRIFRQVEKDENSKIGRRYGRLEAAKPSYMKFKRVRATEWKTWKPRES